MTAEELIEELKKYPSGTEVKVLVNCEFSMEISDVEWELDPCTKKEYALLRFD